MAIQKFYLSHNSQKRLDTCHPHLREIATLAITLTEVDFGISEGKRSVQEQKRLVEAGFSQTMNSRHLTGHAFDVLAYRNGEVTWHWPAYEKIAEAMFHAADKLMVPIEWGGNWETLKDGPHFQLPWDKYPADEKFISYA